MAPKRGLSLKPIPMDEKYYTPDITEFHVGFEFEYKNRKGNWQKDQCGMLGAFHSYQDAISENTIRVRCLCQEDIEALGWQSFKKELRPDNRLQFKQGMYKVELIPETSYVNISFDTEVEGIFDMFIGTIKNRSELKNLMQKIGML